MFVRMKRGFSVLYFFTGLLSFLLFVALVGGILLGPALDTVSTVVFGIMALMFGMGVVVLAYGLLSKFFKRFRYPMVRGEGKPTYGFSHLMVIGLGSTMGASMLTVLPYSINKFSASSTVIAVALSGVISLMLARSYGNMYKEALRRGKEIVGGPSFAKESFGPGAAYFVSRLSMWLGNTALASFNVIIFYRFAFQYIPDILGSFGGRMFSFAGLFAILLAFTFWFFFVLRYERREKLKVIRVQTVLLILFLAFFLLSAYFLFRGPGQHDPIDRVTKLEAPSSIIFASGYIYLVLFGFQEIQAMAEDAKPEAKPFGRRMEKRRYLPAAMVLTVLISSAVFLGYSFLLSKFEISGDIPPLEIAGEMGGTPLAVNSALFMLASLTTLVPAYLAASRHLSELAEDGLIPRKAAPYSWLFTLLTVVAMVALGHELLIEITDVCILISLTLIALSEFKIRAGRLSLISAGRIVLTSLTCLVVILSFYFLKPEVFIYGIGFIMISWFAFTLIGIGPVLNLFFSVLSIIAYLLIRSFGLEAPAMVGWVARRIDVVLLFVGAIYFIDFVFSLDLRAFASMVGTSFVDFAAEISSGLGRLGSAIRRRIGRERLRMDRYSIIESALKLEEMRDKHPELYERLKPLLERDLKKLEKAEEEGSAEG